MSKERILVIDDEEDILEILRYNLSREGFTVDCVDTGEAGLQRCLESPPALAIVDLMLPGVSGLDVCRILRGDARTRSVRIIILTARGGEADIVAGLELGADDYIVKPFSPRVLVARVGTVLRRGSTPAGAGHATISIDDLFVDSQRHEVKLGDERVDLTSTEFKILWLLIQRRGMVFTRSQIVDQVHGTDYPVTDRSIDVQMVSLRKKLGSYGSRVETVRGVGYRFQD